MWCGGEEVRGSPVGPRSLALLYVSPTKGCAAMEGCKQGSLLSGQNHMAAMWKMSGAGREWGQGDQAEGCGS